MKPLFTRHFAVLFLSLVVRAAGRHPVLLGLNVISIALGVAVFLAIQITNRSAAESFRAGVEIVAGRANLEVRGAVPEDVFPVISKLPGVQSATPIVEGLATLPDHPGEYVRILGLDPFSGKDLRSFELLGADRAQIDLEAWLRNPSAIAVSRDFAEKLEPRLGKSFRVLAGGKFHELRPTFILEPEDAAASSDPRLVAMDIGWAQELTDSAGRLSAILLVVADDRVDSVKNKIRSLVPADLTVDAPSRRNSQVDGMLSAFQLNLTALSLVSILVGIFLIYNTVSASVVRRRHEIGTLRALGASRDEVRAVFLSEAAFAGLVGSLIGTGLALPLASFLTSPVEQTISSLYIATSINEIFLSPGQVVLALAVGMAASIVAAWIPASEAAQCDPARVLRPGSRPDISQSRTMTWTLGGITFLALAALFGWLTLELRFGWLGFISAFLVLAGFSLLAPEAIELVARPLRRAPAFFRIAAGNFVRSRHRNAVTVAALAAAIAMTIGVSVMIHSFRGSVSQWINSTLVADLFIGSAANEIAGANAVLPAEARDWLAAQPGVRGVSTFSEISISYQDAATALTVSGGPPPESVRFLGQNRVTSIENFQKPDHVGISEPFANRFGTRRGDRISLQTPGGTREFQVAGIYRDYVRSTGTIAMSRENYLRHWPDRGVQSVAVALDPSVDPYGIAEAFRTRFQDAGQYAIFTNRSLRERIFEIFDQTFAVTLVLRAIAVLVAATGVLLALIILTAEREREIGVLRAIGASRCQVTSLFLREAALIGLTASLLGILSGACLAMILTWVVNKAFFGWTITLSYPIGLLAATPLWIIPIALAAALLPAWRSANLRPSASLRFE